MKLGLRPKRNLPSDGHLVFHGRVFCPTIEADRELDYCLECPALRGIETVDDATIVCCRPPTQRAVPPYYL